MAESHIYFSPMATPWVNDCTTIIFALNGVG